MPMQCRQSGAHKVPLRLVVMCQVLSSHIQDALAHIWPTTLNAGQQPGPQKPVNQLTQASPVPHSVKLNAMYVCICPGGRSAADSLMDDGVKPQCVKP